MTAAVSDTPELTPAEERLAKLRDVELPVRDYVDALRHFRRPFASEAIKWKVQAEWGSGALVVGYIDVRLVIERLNLVWPWWNKDTVAAGQGAARCYLKLFSPANPFPAGEPMAGTRAYEIVKTDVGQGGDVKTMESDAMKRAAVHLGIGVSVYALKQVRVKVGPGDGEIRTERKKKKVQGQVREVDVPTMDDRLSAWLTAGYERWLAAKGERLFGPALDHGDEAGAQGLDSESPIAAAAETGGEVPGAGEVDVSAPAAQIQGERPDELRQMAAGVFAQLRKLKPRALTPGAFQGKLAEAGATSVEALEALVDELEAAVRDAGGGGS